MLGRRIAFVAKGRVVLEDYVVRDPGPGELVLETLFSVVSPGTERANLLAEPNTSAGAQGYPFYPGYSAAGRVARIGAGVDPAWKGRLLATMGPHQSHHVLRPPLGRTDPIPGLPGGGPELLGMTWDLPRDLDREGLRSAASFVIATVGLYGATLAEIRLGDRVAVFGLGPVGLLAGQFARLSGALPLIGVAQTPARRRLALSVGFDRASSPEEAAAELDDDEDAGRTVILEATGVPAGVLRVLEAAPRGARVVLLGSSRGVCASVDFYTLVHRKALTIVGAHQPSRDTADPWHASWRQYWDAAAALRMIVSGRADSGSLISHEFTVDETGEAYDVVRSDPEAQCILLAWS